jgi:hypothetical protein
MSELSEEIGLNLIGVSEGTDKTYLGNDYLRHYARLFAPYRNADITIMEIGIANGGSLRTWRDFFSRATIVGVDIQESARQYAEDRVIVEIGSQADDAFLRMIGDRYRPTIIIDDGSHRSDHQIISLENLFPFLLESGIYVVEDIFFQVNPATADALGGNGATLAIDYLLRLARDRASWLMPHAENSRQRQVIFHLLDRIEFYGGSAAIFKGKKSLKRTTGADLAEAALSKFAGQFSWDHLYNYAMREPDQLLDVAERAANKAFDMSGMELWYHSRLSEIRLKQGKLEDAIAEAERLVELTRGKQEQATYQSRLDKLVAMR